jgi:hypothetical protein
MKYFSIIIVLLFLQFITQAQCKPIHILETTQNGSTTKYMVRYDANGNIEAFSNNLDYTEFYYDEVTDKVFRLKRATIYKNAQMQKAFALQYNEEGQVKNITVFDSLFNGSSRFQKIDTLFNIYITYNRNAIATMQVDETVWYYDKFKSVPTFSISPLIKEENKAYRFEKRNLIQDGSTSFTIKHKCANVYPNNSNLAYFFFLIGNANNARFNTDILLYCALQDIQIQEVNYTDGAEKGMPLFSISQEAFAYNNMQMLKNAGINFYKTNYVNNTAQKTVFSNKLSVEYDCPNFDYTNTPVSCNGTSTIADDKPTPVDNPKKRDKPKVVVKPKVPVKTKSVPKKTTIPKRETKG